MSATRLPNLIIAGVPKAGTTSMFDYLAQHPQVHPSRVKETEFFKRPLGPGHTADDYAAYFSGGGETPVVMEASPGYFVQAPQVVPRVAALLGRPHIVISLREPVSRMRSHHRMLVRAGVLTQEERTFAGFVAPLLDGVARPGSRVCNSFETGRYERYLDLWWRSFGDRVRVVFFDDLVADPQATVRSLCEWLGVDPGACAHLRYEVRNRGSRYRSDAFARSAKRLTRATGALWQRHPRVKGYLRSAHDHLNTVAPTEIDRSEPEELEDRLRALYAGDLAPLSAALRRRGYVDLPDWVTASQRGAVR